jgi:RNA polymerase sigma-70 factor, ECF subfamily
VVAHSVNTFRGRTAGMPWLDGELAARFERDVMPLRRRLDSAALRFTSNKQDAEDLVQDTIMHAYAGFRTFTHGTDPMAWLYRIMQNTWLSRWRRQRRRCAEMPVGQITDDHLSAFAARGDRELRSAEAAALGSLPDNEIREALMALRESSRLTVYYADVHGYSYKDIAGIMDMPVGTVASRLHRGRRQLRTSLAGVASARGYHPTHNTSSGYSMIHRGQGASL